MRINTILPPAFILSALVMLAFNPVGLVGCTPVRTSYQDTSHIIFRENFENDKPFENAYNLEVGDWDYALQYVTQPVFKGKKSARFEIKKDQPMVSHSVRSEAIVIKGIPSTNMWYSFAVYFPKDGFEIDTQREIINQWYQNGTPATSLRVRNDRVYLETGSTQDSREQFDIAPAIKDTWHEFVLHFIHSNGSDGLIEVWHNGEKVFTHKGGNMYKDVLPKWKIGIYKTAFKTGASKLTHRVAYFDNIKVGNENTTYEEMIPSLD